MEIIDKLYLELSHVTTAKTQRELRLESAIKAALRIKDIWLPEKGFDIEINPAEYQALDLMYKRFTELITPDPDHK